MIKSHRFPHMFFALVLLMTGAAGLVVAASYHVNAASGSDGNGGDSGHPFKTITKGLSVAAAGDSILVAPGAYNLALGESFPLTLGQGIKLMSTNGPEATVVDATGANAIVFVCHGNASTLLQGFTITGGMNIGDQSTNFTAQGGGIYCDSNDSTFIRQNIVTGNTAVGYDGTSADGGHAYGGGIYVAFAAPTIVNNVISNNVARGGRGFGFAGGNSGDGGAGGNGQAGGIEATFANAMTIENNTFYGNRAAGGAGGATNNGGGSIHGGNGGNGYAGALTAGSNAVVRNNIFANNGTAGGAPGTGGGDANGTGTSGAMTTNIAANVTNNLFYNNSATTSGADGDTGISAVMGQDPLMHGPWNAHLRAGSPAVNAGTPTGAPATDLDGIGRSGNPDIGAYEAPPGTPVTSSVDNPALNTNVPVGSGVSVNFSSFSGGYVAVDYFASGRTGSLPTANASPYFWTVATSAVAETGTVSFDWSGIAGNGVTHPATVKLLRRSGSGTPWRVVTGTSQSGTHITATVAGFSDFALGGDSDNVFVTGVQRETPKEFGLEQNYPNPFNPATNIEFRIVDFGLVSLKVFDILGREVATLVNEFKGPGAYTVKWDGRSAGVAMPSGVYYYRLTSRSSSSTKKMLILK